MKPCRRGKALFSVFIAGYLMLFLLYNWLPDQTTYPVDLSPFFARIPPYEEGSELAPYLSPDGSFLYCAVPKTGCTMWKRMLHKWAGHSNYCQILGDFNQDRRLGLNRLNYNPDSHSWPGRFWGAGVRLAVVRNPVVRVLSGYLQAGQRHASFDHFLDDQLPVIEAAGGDCGLLAAVNQHWRPQLCFCGFDLPGGASAYTHLATTATVPALVQQLALAGSLPHHLLASGFDADCAGNVSFWAALAPQPGAYPHQKQAAAAVQKHYSAASLARVRHTYAREIELFGFGPEVQQLADSLA